jgi:hypothetical protein
MTWALCEDCEQWHICTISHEWTEWGWWPHFLCRPCQLKRASPEVRRFLGLV